ncbi:hypothetical protein GPECTOR_587g650 [Gonium pectorale]|uniref:Uncharacterized protein n=1 Tax=Gonium pectorale TaxID=33097 RepID=A0A150FUF5_GONPE|nr:hypothetical protein GPECTOR_587g650 [Gonium pectorale]|eukprot:KXZ41273.1 hypothetical protein GPECTOR_587g650 [Gonium pectorale]
MTSETWKIPFDKVVIKSSNINGVMRSLQRRRAAAETADMTEIIEIQDSWRHPLHALQDMGLTHMAQVGQPQVTMVELLHEHHNMEAHLLALLSVHYADLKNFAFTATHRVNGLQRDQGASILVAAASPSAALSAATHHAAVVAAVIAAATIATTSRRSSAIFAAGISAAVAHAGAAPLPPAAPPPPGPILWAVSATASAGHNDASASNAVGAPKKALTKRTECRPAKPTEAWIPGVASMRVRCCRANG